MNLSYVAKCEVSIKEGFESVIQISTGVRQFKFIKFGPGEMILPNVADQNRK